MAQRSGARETYEYTRANEEDRMVYLHLREQMQFTDLGLVSQVSSTCLPGHFFLKVSVSYLFSSPELQLLKMPYLKDGCTRSQAFQLHV
jgi:hypothetical protein